MEGVFTVEEAAGILGCDRATVYRLIANGWLNRPTGGTKKETGGRVTQKSLYQFVIVDRISSLSRKHLRKLKRTWKLFEKSESQMPEASCLSIDEGTCKASGQTDPSPYPLPQGEGKQQRRLNHEFAERHQFSFGWRARQLAPNDPALQDDLVQEMSLAVLEFNSPASFEFLFELANNRAKNYIKYEACRGRMALSEARHVSDSYAEKVVSLNTFIDELLRRGVPAEWIEEVIGRELV
jgi:excisionase family DNA binding protein